MAEDANKKHYFSAEKNPQREREILKQIADKQDTIVLWAKGQTHEESELFEVRGFDANTRTLALKGTNILTKLIPSILCEEKQVYFKCECKKYQYFTTGTLSFDPDTTLHSFTLNNQIFISQRRENYRLENSPNIRILVDIDDETFEGLDVSAGGTSFKISPVDEERFKVGSIFETCSININNINFPIPRMEVVGHWQEYDEEHNLKAIRLGVKFLNINLHVEEKLCKFINSEARAEQIRKSFEKDKRR